MTSSSNGNLFQQAADKTTVFNAVAQLNSTFPQLFVNGTFNSTYAVQLINEAGGDDTLLDTINNNTDYLYLLTNKANTTLGIVGDLAPTAAHKFALYVDIMDTINANNNAKYLLTNGTSALVTINNYNTTLIAKTKNYVDITIALNNNNDYLYLLTNEANTTLSSSADLNSTAAHKFALYVDIMDTINDDNNAKYLLTASGTNALVTANDYNATAAAAFKGSIVALHTLCDGNVDLYCASSVYHPSGTGTGDNTSPYHACATTWAANGLEYTGWVDSVPGTPEFDC